MVEEYQKLEKHIERINALQTALALFNWDMETIAPEGGVSRTARVNGTLSALYYEESTSPEIRALLQSLSADSQGLNENQQAIVKKMSKELERMEKIPPLEYQEYSELLAQSGAIWQKAKDASDYELFKPTLKRIIDFQKKLADYTKKDGQSRYDALLDQYEEGTTSEMLDGFFALVREHVVPLLKQVLEEAPLEKKYLNQKYPIEKQKEFCKKLAEHIGFDFCRGVAGESEHPFTNGLHKDDVRITNHFHEDLLENAMFSVIHEGGHGIYEQNVADEISQTPVGGGTSMGMHESQSRFYENILGRSEDFWVPLWKDLKDLYPDQLKDVSLHDFVLGINYPMIQPIRTEADELTYSLHVMVRYELEKLLLEDQISVDELPKLWNDKYEEYLGYRPKNDREGILQDMHWAGGMFGYFPSYALGNAIGAQIYHWMQKKIDIKDCLRKGDLAPIRNMLTEHIYRYGATRNTAQLLEGMTGEPFNPVYYIQYLEEKYRNLYLNRYKKTWNPLDSMSFYNPFRLDFFCPKKKKPNAVPENPPRMCVK